VFLGLLGLVMIRVIRAIRVVRVIGVVRVIRAIKVIGYSCKDNNLGKMASNITLTTLISSNREKI
jgi:hypothetical protein